MKTDLIKNIKLMSQERFQDENLLDTLNSFTAVVLLLEAKELLTKEEVDDLKEYSDESLKRLGFI